MLRELILHAEGGLIDVTTLQRLQGKFISLSLAVPNTQHTRKMGDYWSEDDRRPIHIKEGQAFLYALQGASDLIANCRVDAYVDSKAVVDAWNGQGSKDECLVAVLKGIFKLLLSLNVDLNVHYIRSQLNPADGPSRSLSWQDASLSPQAWQQVESVFGPHTVDLMALHSNVVRSTTSGVALPFFSPFPI